MPASKAAPKPRADLTARGFTERLLALQDDEELRKIQRTIAKADAAASPVAKADGTASTGYGIADYYLTTEIPQQVKDAQCELAFALMAGHTEGADKIKRWKADDVEIEYDSSGASGSFPPEVDQLIGALIGGVRVVRG